MSRFLSIQGGYGERESRDFRCVVRSLCFCWRVLSAGCTGWIKAARARVCVINHICLPMRVLFLLLVSLEAYLVRWNATGDKTRRQPYTLWGRGWIRSPSPHTHASLSAILPGILLVFPSLQDRQQGRRKQDDIPLSEKARNVSIVSNPISLLGCGGGKWSVWMCLFMRSLCSCLGV